MSQQAPNELGQLQKGFGSVVKSGRKKSFKGPHHPLICHGTTNQQRWPRFLTARPFEEKKICSTLHTYFRKIGKLEKWTL